MKIKIKPEKILQGIAEKLRGIDYIIAGGYPLTQAQNTVDVASDSSDIDLFFENDNEYQKAKRRLCDNPFNSETENATTYWFKFKDVGVQIQLIKIFKPHKETIARFDLCNSMCVIHPSDLSTVYTNQSEDIFRHIKINKELENLTMSDVYRILKYHNNKNISFWGIRNRVYNAFKKPIVGNSLYLNKKADPNMKQEYITFVLHTYMQTEIGKKTIQEQEETLNVLPYLKFGYSGLPTGVSMVVDVLNNNKIKKSNDYVRKNFPELLF